ncbi:MAG: chain length-determining protein [Pseudomonadota bacterium]
MRRLPVMMALTLIFSTLGVITAIKTPNTWSSSAKLLVEAPQIPTDMVGTTVSLAVGEQLDILQQRLLTRANLLDIANRFDVFEDIRDMQPDDIVKSMQQNTSIRRSLGRERATLLTISFSGRSPQVVTDVVNQYVTLVLDENARLRGSRAENTLTFFEQEVERLGADLDTHSAQISVFKTENVDALPDDQAYRLSRQISLQERLSRLEREKSIAETQRDEVVEIFEATGRVGPDATQSSSSPQQQSLVIAEAELELALSQYSESHPRVIRLRDRIKRLEAIIEAQTETEVAGLPSSEEEASPQQVMLQASLTEIENRLTFLDEDITDTNAQLIDLQSAITKSAANGIVLDGLQRDLASTQARYNRALENLNSARMSQRVESTARGQRTTILESAVVPRVPNGPNRPRTAIMGFGIGLLAAAAYFFGLEALNRLVRRPAELIQRFNVVPIAVVPYMESRRERFWRRASIIIATLIVLITVPTGLWYIDQNYMPLELLVQKSLGRLGLG